MNDDFSVVVREGFTKQYPRMKGVEEFSPKYIRERGGHDYTKYELEGIRRYVAYLFDHRSEYAEMTDWEEAKKLAKKAAQVRVNTEVPDELIREMGVAFMVNHGDYRMMELIALRSLMIKATNAALASMDADFGEEKYAKYLDTMGKSMAKFEDWRKQANKLEKELFGIEIKEQDSRIGGMAISAESYAKKKLYDNYNY